MYMYIYVLVQSYGNRLSVGSRALQDVETDGQIWRIVLVSVKVFDEIVIFLLFKVLYNHGYFVFIHTLYLYNSSFYYTTYICSRVFLMNFMTP